MVTESHSLEAMESWSLRILGWAVAAAHTCPHHMQDCQDSPTVDMDHPVLGDIAAAALGFDLIGRLDRVYLGHHLAHRFLSVHARYVGHVY